jgi:Microfibril-associated/Pre-mRNA processing
LNHFTKALWSGGQEEEEAMRREKARAEQRKVETQEIVKSTIELEAAAARAARETPHDLGDVDTDDEKDEEEQYELWKSREMNRIRLGGPPCPALSTSFAGFEEWKGNVEA